MQDRQRGKELLFSSKKVSSPKEGAPCNEMTPWKLMVIDDDEAIHEVTREVFEDFTYQGRGLTIIDGYSGEEARRLMREHPDTAVLLLDVVMESDQAGLEVVRYIREMLNNIHVRIILRTGQPGDTPEKDVILKYDINDYREKSDLTAQKLISAIVTSLRAYNDLLRIEALAASKANLEQKVHERTREILEINQELEREISERIQINEELSKSRNRLAEAQRIAQIGNWEWDLVGGDVFWSDQVYAILGESARDFAPSLENLVSHTKPCDRALVEEVLNRVLREGAAYEVEHSVINADGLERIVYQQGYVDLDEEGRATRLAGTLQDITERRVNEEQMRKLSGVVEQIADAVMITDRDGSIEYVNASFEKLSGYCKDEVLGKRPSLLKSDKQSPSYYARLWRTITRGEVFSDVVINKKKNGELYYEEKTITPQKNPKGEVTHFISTSKDITERMRDQERLHYLAHHDALTGLPNRVLLQDRLTQGIARMRWRGRQIGVMFLDLDRFKIINDTLGHDIGDELLKEMAQRVTDCVRAGDTVARLGGDEFAVLLNDLRDQRDIPPIAEKILRTLATPFHIHQHELFITTSIGVSVFPRDGDDTISLIKKADAAMYRSKAKGKNTYQFYTVEDERRSAERLTLESSLRHALEREEYFLEFQPQFGLADGRVKGSEALLRWKTERFKRVSPVHFIPLLEETGMIMQVGDWVLRTACQKAKKWQEEGLPQHRIAVNISIRQFQNRHFVRSVEQTLSDTGLAPEFLELELTEGLLIEHIAETAKVLHELHELGVHLAIDDFGTGYSSMNYLKRLPFDILKIDRAFIKDVRHNPDDAAITTAIISLAHAMDLQVVAEGVEEQSQLDFLREEGCDLIQGFLPCKPLSSDAFTDFMWQQNSRKSIQGHQRERHDG